VVDLSNGEQKNMSRKVKNAALTSRSDSCLSRIFLMTIMAQREKWRHRETSAGFRLSINLNLFTQRIAGSIVYRARGTERG